MKKTVRLRLIKRNCNSSQSEELPNLLKLQFTASCDFHRQVWSNLLKKAVRQESIVQEQKRMLRQTDGALCQKKAAARHVWHRKWRKLSYDVIQFRVQVPQGARSLLCAEFGCCPCVCMSSLRVAQLNPTAHPHAFDGWLNWPLLIDPRCEWLLEVITGSSPLANPFRVKHY